MRAVFLKLFIFSCLLCSYNTLSQEKELFDLIITDENATPDKEVLDKKFINRVEHSFKVIRPFLNYMTEILTTDENGESLF